MSDDQVTAPMGGDTSAPMGGSDQQISPELLNKPVHPSEGSASDPAVAQQLGLVKQKNNELLGKNKQLVNDLKSLREEFEQLRALARAPSVDPKLATTVVDGDPPIAPIPLLKNGSGIEYTGSVPPDPRGRARGSEAVEPTR